MPVDPAHVGRRYGPYTYEVGAQKLREFAYAVGGGVPSFGFGDGGAPEGLHPALHDPAAAPGGRLVAMPNFAVVYAISPFAAALGDPALGVDLMMVVHGEQTFEFGAPVVAGDVISTSGRVAEVYRKVDKDFVVVETESVNQRGEAVCRARWTAVIRG